MLSSLAVSAGTLSPVFSGDQESYTVPDVPYSTQVLTISADAESGIGVFLLALSPMERLPSWSMKTRWLPGTRCR